MFSFHLKVTYNTKNVLVFSLFSSFRFQFCKCVLQNTQLIEVLCTLWLVRTSCIFCFKAWWVTLSLECFQLVFCLLILVLIFWYWLLQKHRSVKENFNLKLVCSLNITSITSHSEILRYKYIYIPCLIPSLIFVN